MASTISQKSTFKRPVTQKAGVAVVNSSPTGKRILIRDSLRRRFVPNVVPK